MGWDGMGWDGMVALLCRQSSLCLHLHLLHFTSLAVGMQLMTACTPDLTWRHGRQAAGSSAARK
jgi:hypothetical protein